MSVDVVYRPIAPPHLDPVDVARFASRVDLSGGREACWPWQGAHKGKGYGHFSARGVFVGAHRFSLEIKLRRPIRPGLFACHTCDEKGCVNPLHLYEGTPSENNLDTRSRGRHGTVTRPDRILRGSAVGTAKLTEDDVREIRALLETGLTSIEIGRRFNVHHSTIRYIRAGGTWSHLA